MKLIRKLLSRLPARTGRNRLIRGLSTAELVGIIVVVGVLGALGATYISGMVTAAQTNTGNQNAVTLSTLANSYVTGGGQLGAAPLLDLSSASNAITCLNTGITDAQGISYKMSPPIAHSTVSSYTVAGNGTAGNPIIFTYTQPAGSP
ncbi:MAG: hypothetical protein ABSA05_15015 [Opitutaceae bacterium]